MKRIKVLQEGGGGLESNVSSFIRDFWSMKVRIILVSWWERDRERGGEKWVLAYPVSSKTLTIMWCPGEKGAKKGGKRKG